jgi:hypothetical protein
VNRLTKNEQLVLVVFFGLLLLGLGVKYYRLSHPQTASPTKASAVKP